MKEVKKETWKYLVVFFLMALSIGVGNYFNLRAEAGGWGMHGYLMNKAAAENHPSRLSDKKSCHFSRYLTS